MATTARLDKVKPRARNFCQVSYMGGRSPNIWIYSTAFPRPLIGNLVGIGVQTAAGMAAALPTMPLASSSSLLISFEVFFVSTVLM